MHEFYIDARHRDVLRDVAAGGGFRVVAEVGSFRGYSTAALIDAQRIAGFELLVCDRKITKELRRVVEGAEGVRLFEQSSVDFLAAHDPDFVFLDADHTLPGTSADLEILLAKRPRCIVAHDTSLVNQPGRARLCGPAYLKRKLQFDSDYFCVEDNLLRPGEVTERGLLLAALDPETLAVGRAAFRRHCL